MNSIVLISRFARQSTPLRQLLSPSHHFRPQEVLICRSFKLWQEKTLKLMYHRKRLFDAVKPNLWQEKTLKLMYHRKRLFDAVKPNVEPRSRPQECWLLKCSSPDFYQNSIANNEFIQNGQNICQSFIKTYLRHFLPRLPEDGVCAIHDYLTSDEVLADVAKWIGCIDLVLCEEFPPNETTLANTVRALIGAAAEDHTIKRAENFILDFVMTYLLDKDLLEIWDIPNPRFNLNAILSRERLPAPEYRLLRESAAGTIEACYVVGIYVDKQFIGSAPGETIEIGKQMAELDALRRLFRLQASEVLFKFGPKAYDIDMSESSKETLHLDEWSPSLLDNKRMKTKQIL
ncbi:unnamed protein product [Medioppia subpectinata]|uniref:Large ribosomal subunit protein mL44 n=1 Tax=Medioppia subpectinata TaxID=1979941 RepID=A0A7R9L4I9_9ACAR|nr:unnamed protein product [Medioppia subpectinata]CAG2115206.1 unnamed protein product [Medioppia subpectinata]